jgi:uncharacterized protein YqgV (UPF0045/DUF77 family)
MLAAFSISPMGAGDSVGEAVAAIVRVVRDSGLPNETTAMYTTVEGEPRRSSTCCNAAWPRRNASARASPR